MNTFVEKIEEYICNNNMIHQGDTLIVGLSGGADSVCLLCVLNELKYRFAIKLIAVHVHHGIRGGEADNDADYTKTICDAMSIPHYLIKENVKEISKKLSLSEEEAGRMVRYEAFNKIAAYYEELGEHVKIAVAHNMNDNAETILFNIFRGSMLNGLAGIRPVNGKIIRPLLETKRECIENYLNEKEIAYCTDSTNLEDEYTRNIMRHKILPVAGEINSRAVEHLCETAKGARKANDYIKICGEEVYCKIVCITEDKIYADAKLLKEQHEVIREYIYYKMIGEVIGSLKDVGQVHVRLCEDILNGRTGRKYNLQNNVIVSLEYDKLVLQKESQNKHKQINEKNTIIISKEDINKMNDENGITIKVKNGEFKLLIINKNSINISKNIYTKYFDYDTIKSNFSIRNRCEGDYLVVNSNGNTKKLNRFFIDNKVPVSVRDDLFMLAAGHEILVIPGFRGTESHHVTDDTERILEVTFLPTKVQEG